MAELIDPGKLKQIVEAALMAADEPLTMDQLQKLFAHGELDSEEGRAQIRDTLKTLEDEAEGRGYALRRVASGYRYQVRQELSEWVSRLWEDKPPRYSRALLETLALIAYKQPVTRGDIEQVRGVAVSQNIMRTLLERNWIRVVGQREVPGKPSLYGTTREFLDYFDLKSLDQLPPLAEIHSLIEPLVVEEVVEEARQVAGRDHHDQSTDREPSAHAGSEEAAEGEEAARGEEAAEGEAVQSVEGADADVESADAAQRHEDAVAPEEGDWLEARGRDLESRGPRSGSYGREEGREEGGKEGGEAAPESGAPEAGGPETGGRETGNRETGNREAAGNEAGRGESTETPTRSAEVVRLPRAPRR